MYYINYILYSLLYTVFSTIYSIYICIYLYTLTRLSFYNLESDSPTSSTTERETIVHGVIFSVCWCSQFPLRFAGFLPSFSGTKNIDVKWDQWIWLIPVAERRASFCHTHFSSSPCCQRTLAETGGFADVCGVL